MILLFLIIAIAIVLFYLILEMDIPGLWKFGLVAIEMILVSQIFIRKYKTPSELGLVLVKSKKGIALIDSIAKNSRLLTSIITFLSDTGNAIAYGLLSLVITRKNMSFDNLDSALRTIASVILGLCLLLFIAIIVAPTSLGVLLKMLEAGTMEKTSASVIDVFGGEYAFWILVAILIGGGLFLFILLGLVYYGGFVLSKILDTLIYGSDAISQVEPGGHLLLPGVNLPLFEGIIALTIVMIVHEGAHAVLARIGKIPVVSSGLVFFGVIPVGAFVEPDEKKLAKADELRQTRVLVAGSTSNLMTSCALFVLLLIISFSIMFLETTNDGGLVFIRDALNLTSQNPVMPFIKTTLGLAFALNFVVGAVNLLPLPLFDGYRLVEVNIKNKLLVKTVMYITLIAFILNFLPWFFG